MRAGRLSGKLISILMRARNRECRSSKPSERAADIDGRIGYPLFRRSRRLDNQYLWLRGPGSICCRGKSGLRHQNESGPD